MSRRRIEHPYFKRFGRHRPDVVKDDASRRSPGHLRAPTASGRPDRDRGQPRVGVEPHAGSPAVAGCFDAWRVDFEQTRRAEEEHPVLLSHCAKYRSLMPSLALLGPSDRVFARKIRR